MDISSFDESRLLAARRGPDGLPTPSPNGAPAGLIAVGGYHFRQDEIDAAVAATDPTAVIAALPDALLGQRLAGSAPDPVTTAAQLLACGVNALVAGAFRAREKVA